MPESMSSFFIFPGKQFDVSKKEALEHFNSIHENYKVELINDLEDGKITYYKQGTFTDLCRGPHLPDTSYIKAIKLTSLAGAYWRGNEHNKMLTRIYGITFPKQKMLDEWLVSRNYPYHIFENVRKSCID